MSELREKSHVGVSEMVLAGFDSRLFASLIDGLMTLGIASVFGLVQQIFTESRIAFYNNLAFNFVAIILIAINQIYLVGKTGRSVGRRIIGIEVVNERGDSIGTGRAFLRIVVAGVASSSLLCLGYLWVLWDADKQAWHDKILNTYVVK